MLPGSVYRKRDYGEKVVFAIFAFGWSGRYNRIFQTLRIDRSIKLFAAFIFLLLTNLYGYLYGYVASVENSTTIQSTERLNYLPFKSIDRCRYISTRYHRVKSVIAYVNFTNILDPKIFYKTFFRYRFKNLLYAVKQKLKVTRKIPNTILRNKKKKKKRSASIDNLEFYNNNFKWVPLIV